ncbi:glycosyltransferase family 1 protein [Mucilaginibacter sp. Bleaf8]|uniref:glycosyltransferase family 4 protein n=1 Tax=Mucilaginibacter sp. Bleaf8 TaxID=2834430 RepID=UPI001BCC2237|nr:glycosyltransferase family 1 protein [Mucilaginibacter sp. Bleaf8]MBS7564692.1 glycosyltransferase family 1 protein [Mucilaginibacter sp. Bleaf8]
MKSNQPRIAFISEHASPLATLGGVDTGGQNVYVAQVVQFLAKIGYLVDVFTRWEDAAMPQVINWLPGVRVVHVKAGPVSIISKEEILEFMPEFTQSILNFIRAEGISYDLSHANFFMSGLVAANLKKILGLPFAITFHALGHVRRIHQGDSDKFPAERLQIEEDVVKQADYIIAECPQDRDDLINYYKAPSYKIVIIPCGFSSKEFYPIEKAEARKLLNIETDKHIILQLGRMVPRKGVDNVIRSLSKLKDKQSVLLLVVGGDCDEPDPVLCPEIGRLQKIAAELGVEASVQFTGRKSREELKFYYAAADIFISTPWYEPFGITPLEAMACGTPVIGSNVGGIKYTVVDGETGGLVEPEDPQALAEKIEELISEPTLLKQMGLNAIKRVNNYFTWAHVADKISTLYIKMLNTGSKVALDAQLHKLKKKAA